MMETVAEGGGHIVATASYREYRDKKESHLPATVEGVQTPDDEFWPRVTAQVASDIKGEWTILEPSPQTGDDATVTLNWKSANAWLHLNLDIFRSMIGKFKYGKVTLTNGQAAAFEMENLLPPAVPPHAWDMTVNFLEGDPPNLPFAVVEINSLGEDLLAVCEYLDEEGTAATSINGTQTPDGHFWPYVIAQIATDYNGVWKTIGRPPNVGKQATVSIPPKDVDAKLYIDLEIFRPFIGKFRYGRVILEIGKAAPFELHNLLPPEEKADLRGDAKKRPR
jgi:hypothetical protein